MSHKLLIADYPSCGKCRKESEAVGRCELLRSVITNVDLGQIPVIVSIGGPGRDTNYIERNRSEEHTSELQSLMRISYAVFCLTKEKHTPSQKDKGRANG